MGEYFKIVNLSKGQFLHPHKLAEGLKRFELGSNCMTALSYLLARGEGMGPLEGSWRGDSIAILGDYRDSEEYDALEEGEGDIPYQVVLELGKATPWFFERIAARYFAWDPDMPAELHAAIEAAK